jgi:serine/threonine-protein kinase
MPDDGHTRDGTVVGTPAFMAPEQARGLVDSLDARTDVFGLGGILCAILTGKAPFTGGPEKARRQAVTADLGEAHSRLGSCGADLELIALARRCLQAKQSERPADGGEVARAVAGYLDGVQRRLQESECDRARAEVRVVEERKRRRLTALVAALVLTLLLAGGVGAWTWQRQQQREAEQVARTRQRVDELTETVDSLLHQGRWSEARSSLEQVEQLLPRAGDDEERTRQLGRLKEALELGQELDSVRRERLVLIEGGTLERAMPRLYRQALARHGFDIDSEEAQALGKRVATSPVKEVLLATLDDAAFLEKDDRRQERLLRAARLADPGAWQDRLRDQRVPRVLELYRRLESVRLGKSKPRDAREALLLAYVAGTFAWRGALATGLYREAFEREPAQGDDLGKTNRFLACLVSLQAGLGLSVDSPEARRS